MDSGRRTEDIFRAEVDFPAALAATVFSFFLPRLSRRAYVCAFLIAFSSE